MKKSLLSAVAISALALVLVAVMFVMNNGIFAARASGGGALSIHVVEHARTDTVGDFENNAPSPDALGNVLAFHNPVFDATDTQQVGVDNGQCTRTIADPTNGVWECFWTVILSTGQITVEGPFNDNGTDTMLAITGGTGAYQGAHGQMRLHLHSTKPKPVKYDFFYQVEF
jgi:allene oxide cyclase